MNWLKNLLNKIFRKKDKKLISQAKKNTEFDENKNNFKINLKQTTDLECSDGNGYKIAPKLRLKDMI